MKKRIIAAIIWLSASVLQSFSQITGPIEYMFQAEDFSALQGVTFDAPVDKNPRISINACGNGDWIRYDSISFLNGEYDSMALYYFVSYPQDASNGYVRVRVDSPTGAVIATFSGLGNQRAVQGEPAAHLTAQLAQVTGMHTVYLTFAGSNNICDVDKMKFIGRITAAPSDAKTYYVSTTGDDGHDGLSLDSPFRTVQKAASVMKPGSRCLIRQGIYRETVRPAYTGIAGATLSFEAYNGENVVIDGADPITGWTVHSGSIYKAPMPSSIGKYRNQVLVDGDMAWLARSPNVDENYQPHPWQVWCGSGLYNWKKWQSVAEPIAYPARICIGENGSHGTPPLSTAALYDFDISQVQADWTANQIPTAMLNRPADFLKGGLVTIHNLWWAALGEIANSALQSATKTVFNSSIYQGGYDGAGPGWVSHVFGLLDAPNEWYRDSASQTLYLWTPDGGDPSQHLVEAKKRTLGFDLRGKQYVNLTGLHFLATSLTMAEANNCIVDKCIFKYISHYDDFQWYESAAFWQSPFDPTSGYTGVYVSGYNNIIKNSLFRGSAGSGVIMNGRDNTVTNCIIHSCDYAATYQAGVLVMRRTCTDIDAYSLTISHNTIQHNGRFNVEVKSASSTPQQRVRVEYNDFGPSGYLLKESASVCGQAAKVEVSHNYFHGEGCRDGGDVMGESDMGGTGWIVHHNVFWQGETPQAPLTIVGSHWCFAGDDTASRCFNNTVVDSCAPGTRDRDTGLAVWYTSNTIYARSDTAPWMFSNPLQRDYTLRAGSPAIDKGKVIPGWETTFSGSAPDLGAYEYGQPRWIAGADWQEPAWTYPPSDASTLYPGLQGPAAEARMPAVAFMRDRVVFRGLQGAGYRAALCNMQGALVASVNRPEGGIYSLTTHRLAQGMYALKIACGNRTMVRKFAIGPTRE
jgi:hypothetical protein